MWNQERGVFEYKKYPPLYGDIRDTSRWEERKKPPVGVHYGRKPDFYFGGKPEDIRDYWRYIYGRDPIGDTQKLRAWRYYHGMAHRGYHPGTNRREWGSTTIRDENAREYHRSGERN